MIGDAVKCKNITNKETVGKVRIIVLLSISAPHLRYFEKILLFIPTISKVRTKDSESKKDIDGTMISERIVSSRFCPQRTT